MDTIENKINFHTRKWVKPEDMVGIKLEPKKG